MTLFVCCVCFCGFLLVYLYLINFMWLCMFVCMLVYLFVWVCLCVCVVVCLCWCLPLCMCVCVCVFVCVCVCVWLGVFFVNLCLFVSMIVYISFNMIIWKIVKEQEVNRDHLWKEKGVWVYLGFYCLCITSKNVLCFLCCVFVFWCYSISLSVWHSLCVVFVFVAFCLFTYI